ncbi:MAG: ABC transporter ATP-binding protein [Phycisphaerae bacterium]|nr:ABC transporter ATP-binding protein [Phycisphaerae bacterium]
MTIHEPIIHVKHLHKAFGRLVVLDGVNLAIRPGQTTVIIGPSGCGKSVLLKSIVGLVRPDRGRVMFQGVNLTKLSERKLARIRTKFGFLFQGAALFDSMTVGENVAFPLEEHEVGTSGERIRRVADVLGMVGLDGLQDRFPEELSGGQKKRVALARAIVLNPEVILYDEPTTGLDPIRSDLINELIRRLQRTLNVTSIVVTHDMASARRIADRILMLHKGKFIADAAPDHLDTIQNDTVRRFIEGRADEEELSELSRGTVQ